MTPSEIVAAFVNRINAHDVDGVCALMEDDHVFVDGLGGSVTGREAMRRAWHSYFATVPDYWIRVERQLQQGAVVGIFGKAGGTLPGDGRPETETRREVPAAWLAIVGDTGIAAWEVFADNEPVRRYMSRVAKNVSPPTTPRGPKKGR